MSVFAQYVPHTFAAGSWDDHRERVRKLASIPSAASVPTFPMPCWKHR